MNTDFRVSIMFTRHTKTRLLKKRLGLEANWALLELWTWAAVNRADGILSGMNEEQIEVAADWNGQNGELIKNLVELHWLDKLDDGTYVLHQWEEHNPWAADAGNRSDKARFSGLARHHYDLYKTLAQQGITSLTKDEYARVLKECKPKKKHAQRSKP